MFLIKQKRSPSHPEDDPYRQNGINPGGVFSDGGRQYPRTPADAIAADKTEAERPVPSLTSDITPEATAVEGLVRHISEE